MKDNDQSFQIAFKMSGNFPELSFRFFTIDYPDATSKDIFHRPFNPMPRPHAPTPRLHGTPISSSNIDRYMRVCVRALSQRPTSHRAPRGEFIERLSLSRRIQSDQRDAQIQSDQREARGMQRDVRLMQRLGSHDERFERGHALPWGFKNWSVVDHALPYMWSYTCGHTHLCPYGCPYVY